MKKLKVKVALAFALATAVLSAHAQILYKVEKPGSDKVSYLLGTHHFAPLSVVDSIAELPAMLGSVDKLYGEIDMSSMTDPSFMMSMQQKMMAPADSTLDKVLTPAQYAKLGEMLNSYAGQQIPLQMLNAMKPAMISAQLAQLMSMKVLPQLNGLEGIDMIMQQRARKIGKPVAGLETLDFQMNMLYGCPIAEQAADLVEVIENPGEEEQMAVDISNAYLNHNIEKILEMMIKMEAEKPESAEKIIYGRNDNWVKQLSKEMPDASLMVVVGAGHLPGDRGVIKGLEKEGFKVTPIR